MSQVGFFFYPGDWIKDTRVLTLQCRGAWFDLICELYEHHGEIVWTLLEFARFWGTDEISAETILLDLAHHKIAEITCDCKIMSRSCHAFVTPKFALGHTQCHGHVTLWSRRIARELKKKENSRLRKEKQRDRQGRHRNVTLESHDFPSSLLNPSLNPSKNLKNKSTQKLRVAIPKNPDFPPEWKWLEDWVRRQTDGFPVDRFLDWSWWDAVSETCGGLGESWLEVQAASWKRWIMDNPTRAPTPKGYRTFVAGWLERSYTRERRFPSGQTKK